MSFVVISCSLNAQSRSRAMAHAAMSVFQDRNEPAKLIDLRELGLPLCDGGAAYGHPAVAPLAGAISAAKGVVLAFPVYNYAENAACKNLIELTGKAWTGKVVGLLAAAGGPNAFMSPLQIAGSLMLDFRCIVLPRYVYAAGEGVTETGVTDAEVSRRIGELVGETIRVGKALA